ncbi:hypothetical protein CHH73_09210 [Shouchella clausii]|nr:hypothetical protein CHH73_09210 [Shouchella clausii]
MVRKTFGKDRFLMNSYTKGVIACLAVGLLLFVGFGYSIYEAVLHANNNMHTPLHSRIDNGGISEKREATAEPGEPLALLIAGIDKTAGSGYGRSDALMVATVNAKAQSVKLVSIPRDTKVQIAGRSMADKLNHAHAYGGPDLMVQTVEELLHIPIDHYIAVDMDGFVDVINTLGGVSVVNEKSFSIDGYAFPKGTLSLNGEKALAYVRMRKEDPAGDAGRTSRQRDVMESAITKGLQVGNLANIPAFLQSLSDAIETDLTLTEMLHYVSAYRPAAQSIKQLDVAYREETVDGLWFAVLPQEEVERIGNELRTHLTID